jgi:CHAT domain-containing protein
MSSFVRGVFFATLVVLQAPALADPAPAAQVGLALEREFTAAFDVLMAGQLQTGLPMMEAALKRSQRELGEQAAHTLKVHDFYAATLMRLGRLDQARSEFELILARHRAAGTADSRSALSSLNNLGNVVANAESPQAALPLFKQALEQRARTLGDDDLESCSVLADYAWALGESGQLHQSLALAERALALRVKLQGERHSWTLTALNNFGHTLFQLGRYSDALAVHEKVLKTRLADSGERHPSTLVAMNNTALTLRHLGRFEEARVLHQRAVGLQTEILGPTHFSTLTGRRGLASDLAALGRTDEALAALRPLLADSLQAYGPKHRHALYTRVELALALERAQRLDQALAELETALAIYLDSAGPEHFNSIEVGVLRARLLRLLGRPAEATAELRGLHALALQHYGARFSLSLMAAAELAANLAAAGKLADAEPLLAGVVEAAEALRAELPAGEDDGRRQQHRRFAEAYRLQVRVLAGLGRLDEAFVMLERSKARSLLEQMSERASALAAGVSAAQWAELQMAREAAHVLSTKLREAKSTAERQDWLAQLSAAQASGLQVQAALRAQYPGYSRASGLQPAGPGDAGLLPRTGLLISYSLEADENRLSALTLDPQGRVQWHPLGRLDGLAEQIEALRLWSTQQGPSRRRLVGDAGQALEVVRWQPGGQPPRWRVVAADAADCPAAQNSPAACRPPGAQVVWQAADYEELRRSLADQLLMPLRTRLAGHGQWLISPDKALGLLPFDVLPWQGRALADTVALSQLQSLSVLRAARAARPAAAPQRLALFAIGNPEFAATAGEAAAPWPLLPASQIEMEHAAAQFKKQGGASLILSGLDASEERLRAASAAGELATARHVLFASHAWFDPERPQASKLILRGAGAGAGPLEDGELSIGDLAGLRLNSQLVVMSACNTGRSGGSDGGSASNEGQFGFAYGLSLAGNRNALLTLWPVQDQASAAFVARFFAHVAKGRPPAQALQATKREFLQHPNPRWREPRYWAGFVLFGA